MNADSTSSQDVRAMIDHWISTPENGYLGSSYGFRRELLEITMSPQSDDNTKILEDKLKLDIPMLANVALAASWVAMANEILISIDGAVSTHTFKRVT